MQTILDQLKIKADVVDIQNNGTMSKYFLQLHPGAKVSKIENCATEIALGIKAFSKPIVRVITERGLVSVELLTKPTNHVSYIDVDPNLQDHNYELPMILGRTHDGKDLTTDLSIMPHLLVAGTTGSGKSVLLHSILCSLFNVDNIKLALVDPKKVEFSYYSDVKQLMYPIVVDADDALCMLEDLIEEMEARFRKMSRASVNRISDYNIKYPKRQMPYIVLVIDEFSDLMHSSKKIFQKHLCVLAQKSRSAGMHIVIATQRPSVDVITGIIKANFPSRISCRVSSGVDSRVVLGCNGAERLLGKGDALINSIGLDMIRFQGAYLSVDEIEKICSDNKRSGWNKFINKLRGN